MNTIAAVSTPWGSGGIGILRVSGEDALRITGAIFVCKGYDAKADTSRILADSPLRLTFGWFDAGDFKDFGYAVYFPREKAFTGEPTVEFYLHGGVRIMRGALEAILKKGAVPAERGEFTKRAFLNGRVTLADAEGVGDMIAAESAAGIRAAYRLMQGGLSQKIEKISRELLNAMAPLEAALDYPEEIGDEIIPDTAGAVKSVLSDVNKLISTCRLGRIAKHGLSVVLAGPANAGKSSLLNAMLGTERAIVASVPGTTRDTVSESMEIGGVRINLTDTAGLRESGDEVEMKGIQRSRQAIEGADVVINVIDTLTGERADICVDSARVFDVYNKCDLTSFRCPRMRDCFAVSAKTGQGVYELLEAIASVYREGESAGGEIITSERHISALERAKSSLESSICDCEATVDCMLIDLRAAYDALGEITGRCAGEDIVNEIFSKFCVGK